jgi:hypothetical protein
MAGVAAGVDRNNGRMTVSTTITGVLIGLVIGFPAGWLYATTRRSWNDLRTARKGVPTARKNAVNRTREALILIFILAIVGAVGIGIARGR